MTDDEKYLFDLMGYLVLRQVLTPQEVARCNEAIDRHVDRAVEDERSLAAGSEALEGTSHRKDLTKMLGWERPWCEPFRELLVHPTVMPYLETILGKAFRLDHGPGLIVMELDAKAAHCTAVGSSGLTSAKPTFSRMGGSIPG